MELDNSGTLALTKVPVPDVVGGPALPSALEESEERASFSSLLFCSPSCYDDYLHSSSCLHVHPIRSASPAVTEMFHAVFSSQSSHCMACLCVLLLLPGTRPVGPPT